MPMDLIEIDLNKLDPEFIRRSDTPLDQANRRRIAQWMQNVSEIQRRCRTQRLRAEDFLALRTSPDTRDRALAETYERVYERPLTDQTDCVAVHWNQQTQRYEVSNGSNRLLTAQELKLNHYPATVFAADVAALRRLRSEGRELFGHEMPERGLRHFEREHQREQLDQQEAEREKQREQRRKRERQK